MSIGVYSGHSSISIIEVKANAPMRTAFIGELPLPELAAVTTVAFVKPRFADAGDKANGADPFGTKSSKFGLNYTPWGYSAGSPSFQFPKVGMFSSVQMLTEEQAYSTGSGWGFEDSSQSIADDDGGTFQTDARSNSLIPSSTVTSDERWYAFFTVSLLPSGTITNYLIDPIDGTVLYTNSDTDAQDGNDSPFVGGTPIDASRFFGRIYGQGPNDTVVNDDWDYKLAEMCIWHEEKSLATMQAFAQVGFAAINEPSGLVLDWNFMLDWRLNNSAQIDDQSGNGNHGDILDTGIRNQFFTDNPVPVFIPQVLLNEHDFIRFDLFSGSAGTIYAGIYPRAATPPTASALASGSGALTVATVVGTGTSSVALDIDQPDTGTDYTVYFTQDTTGSGDYTDVFDYDYTSPTKYSETAVDIEDEDLPDLVDIQYSWFDSVDVDNMGPVKHSGSAEATDRDALLEITLPTTISTNKGEFGIMVLKVITGEITRTATHISEVK